MRSILAGIAVGVAVLVAGTRVLLDVHWLSDTIAGVALGWSWFMLCAIAFGGRLLQFGAVVEEAADEAVEALADAAPRAARRTPALHLTPSATYEHGGAALTAVALGLVVFGAYSLMDPRYRKI